MMIDAAPRDFWQQVILQVAKLIWERETKTTNLRLVETKQTQENTNG